MSAQHVRRSAHVILACALCFAAACSRDRTIETGTPVVEFRTADSAEYGAVDVLQLGKEALDAIAAASPSPDQWREILPVRVNDTSATPMFGEYVVMRDRIRFTPRFAPSPGNTYYATFHAGAFERLSHARPPGNAGAKWEILAAQRAPTTAVAAIYPSADDVPMNLLKLYIHFTAPMSVGESMQRISITDDSGKIVEDAFLIPSGGEELWNPEKTRLTLLFDPGRIKRELRPNEERGLPLQSGRRYIVTIDSAWKDATGTPLARTVKKTLRVGAPDRTSPRIANWRVTAPAAGTRNPLVVRFAQPLDEALLRRMLTVRTAGGDEVRGSIVISDQERRWEFTPATAWSAGAHYVEADTDLEDLAGNSIRKLFDMAPGDSALKARTVKVGFSPK